MEPFLTANTVSLSEVGTDGVKIVSNIKVCNVSFATVVSSVFDLTNQGINLNFRYKET